MPADKVFFGPPSAEEYKERSHVNETHDNSPPTPIGPAIHSVCCTQNVPQDLGTFSDASLFVGCHSARHAWRARSRVLSGILSHDGGGAGPPGGGQRVSRYKSVWSHWGRNAHVGPWRWQEGRPRPGEERGGC